MESSYFCCSIPIVTNQLYTKLATLLQRAERSKLRRQSFHGYTLKEQNAESKGTSCDHGNIFSQDMLCADNRASKSFSVPRRPVSKRVSFTDSIEIQQPLSTEGLCERNGCHFAKEISLHTPQGVTSQTLHHSTKDCKLSTVVVEHCVTESRDLVLSSKETTSINVSSEEATCKLNFQEQDEDQHHKVVANIDHCNDSVDHHSNHRNNEIQVGVGNEVTLCLPVNEVEHNARQDKQTNYKNVLQACSSEKCARDFVLSNETHHSGDVLKQESSYCSGEIERSLPVQVKPNWMHLFEEEYPRRSPRLRSIPNYVNKVRFPEKKADYVKQPFKLKTARKQKSRFHKVVNLGNECKLFCKKETSLFGLPENQSVDNLVFPRPSLEQTTAGGPLSVIVDFSLPDKDFAKLKLAKIKSHPSRRVTGEGRSLTNGCQNKDTQLDFSEEAKLELGMTEKHAASLPKSHIVLVANSLSGRENGKEDRENVSTVSMEIKEMESNFQILTSSSVYCPPQQNTFWQKQNLQTKAIQQTLIASEVKVDHRSNTLEMFNDAETYLDLDAGVENENELAASGNPRQSSASQKQNSRLHQEGIDTNQTLVLNDIGSFCNEHRTNLTFHKHKPVVHENCGHQFPMETTDKETSRSPDQLENHSCVLRETQEKSSLYDSEPSIGDQATPHGKMKMPCDRSQLALEAPTDSDAVLSPVLMMACLQVDLHTCTPLNLLNMFSA